MSGLRPGSARTNAVLLWLAIVSAYFYPTFLFPIHNPNERVRIYMTAAMVEEGSFAIGRRVAGQGGRGYRDEGVVYERWGYVNDKALVCDDPGEKPPNCAGLLYSAKAPGTSLVGYPFHLALHWIGRVGGFEPSMEALILWLRLFTILLPTLAMLVLFRRHAFACGYEPVLTDLVTLGMAVGSMTYTYSHMFAGHQLAALLLFFAWLAAWRARGDGHWRWPLLSGLAGSAAVATEYPMVLVVLILFLFLMLNRPSWRAFALYCGGSVVPAGLTAWFHTAAFGAPWRTAYATLENPQFVEDIAPGIMGLREPQLENLYGAFVAPFEGLFYFAPWMVLVVPALVLGALLWRRMPVAAAISAGASSVGSGREFLFASLAVAALTLFISCHSLWRGGWTLGPRYIVPIVPFTALVVLQVGSRLASVRPVAVRAVVAGLVLASLLVTGLSSLVSQGFHTVFFNPLREVTVPLLRQGYVTLNVGHLMGLTGLWSVVPMALLVLPGLVWLFWRLADGRPEWRGAGRLLVASCACLLAAGVFWALTLPSQPATLKRQQALRWTQDNFYPDRPRTADLLERSLLREAVRVHPESEALLVLELGERTLGGQCKESAALFERWQRAERRRVTTTALEALLSGVAGGGFPIPMLVRPEYRTDARRR